MIRLRERGERRDRAALAALDVISRCCAAVEHALEEIHFWSGTRARRLRTRIQQQEARRHHPAGRIRAVDTDERWMR